MTQWGHDPSGQDSFSLLWMSAVHHFCIYKKLKILELKSCKAMLESMEEMTGAIVDTEEKKWLYFL